MSLTKTRGAKELARYIDHTLLKPNISTSELETLCREACEYQFFSVCIPPSQVEVAKNLVSGSSVKICTVIGFPLGYSEPEVKAYETKLACEKGADEIDMVINNIAVKNQDFSYVEKDIRAVVDASSNHLVKVILETSLLSDNEIEKVCLAAQRAGADFVKTSTGFTGSGATVDAVALMRKIVGETMGVKASGGIRNFAQAEAMITAGANRLGCSAGVQIVSQENHVDTEGGY